MQNDTTNNRAFDDERGELLSAYVDGEATAAEAARAEQMLAEDPTARRYADELSEIGQAVRRPLPGAPGAQGGSSQDASAEAQSSNEWAGAVVAEALRRQAAGEATPQSQVTPLEPEGAFGLPFGGASRSWAWAGVAVAAALLIGFYGRPGQPTGQGNQIAKTSQNDAIQQVTAQRRAAFERALAAMQQTTPGLQVVNYQATPQTLSKLQQRLALRRASLPGALTAAGERGVVVEPVSADETLLEDGEEELLYVDADPAELTRMLEELESDEDADVYRVESGSPKPAQSATAAAAPQPQRALPAVRLRVRLRPDGAIDVAPLAVAQGNAGPKKVLLLRVRVVRPSDEN